MVVPRSRKAQDEVSPCPALWLAGQHGDGSGVRVDREQVVVEPLGDLWVAGGDVDKRRLGRAAHGDPRHESLLDSREPGSGQDPLGAEQRSSAKCGNNQSDATRRGD